MNVYTRFGFEVSIVARCDDYGEELPFVHIEYKDTLPPTKTVPIWELRTEGGLAALIALAEAAPLAGCTGKHDERVAKAALGGI